MKVKWNLSESEMEVNCQQWQNYGINIGYGINSVSKAEGMAKETQ